MSRPHELTAFLEGKEPVLQRDGIEYFVVVPRTLEWAAAVRLRLKTRPAAAVAVTLPETLRPLVPQVLPAFPSMVFLASDASDAAAPATETAYRPAESIDARWEALRTAAELQLPWRAVGPDGEMEDLTPPEEDGAWLSRVSCQDMMRCILGRHLSEKTLRMEESTAMLAAFHLASLRDAVKAPVLFVCTPEWVEPVMHAMESPPAAIPLRRTRREEIRAYRAGEDLAAVACAEPMGFVEFYESWRRTAADGTAMPDRYAITLSLLQDAVRLYDEEFSTRLPKANLSILLRYMRNLALTQNRIFPTRYDLIMAARAFYDQHFGWFFFQRLTKMPPGKAELPVLEMDPQKLGIPLRHVQFAFRLRQQVPRFLSAFRSRPREPRPGEWKKAFNEAGMCSYPPEDVFIEGSVRHLKHKGQTVIGERTHRSEPFSCTPLDGLDLRETLRHWHERRIWVREEISAKSKVGSVVIIFDEDERSSGEEKYPYCAHWHGEHDQESDMAFYATNPDDHVTGPGICRCEYGGLLMTSPPGRMWPVWEDPHLLRLGAKSDLLLAAGLQLTQEPVVLYIAPRPPRAYLKHIASRMGLRVLYLPIGTLSPERIRKLRTFHILAGHAVRQWARHYIVDP